MLRAKPAKPTTKPLKRKLNYRGLDIAIEYEMGDVKKGMGSNGEPWEMMQCCPYGYLYQRVDNDGEYLDVFLGRLELADEVFIIDLMREDGFHDEQKVFIGFGSQQSAEDMFDRHYTRPHSRGGTHRFSFYTFSGLLHDHAAHSSQDKLYAIERSLDIVEKARQSLEANRRSVAAYRAKASTKKKRKAQWAVARDVENGKLKKPKSCPKCGKSGIKIEGHHPNYDNQTQVRWRCRVCHAAEDKNLHGENASRSQKNRKPRK